LVSPNPYQATYVSPDTDNTTICLENVYSSYIAYHYPVSGVQLCTMRTVALPSPGENVNLYSIWNIVHTERMV